MNFIKYIKRVALALAGKTTSNAAAADAVVEAFNSASKGWSRNTFTYGGVKFVDSNGNDTFFACKDVDEAVRRLNEVLNDLRRAP